MNQTQDHQDKGELSAAELEELWNTADQIWTRNQSRPAFDAYVSADYQEVHDALKDLRSQAATFVEWGSGLGVVTIMASRLGFEAYGIEAEEELVVLSESLAHSWAPRARFAHGSFIPDSFCWDPGQGDEAVKTMIDVPDGYAELDMELRDFDLIYSYPWPTEHTLYHNIMRQFAHSGSRLLTFDAREGIDIVTFAELDAGYGSD